MIQGRGRMGGFGLGIGGSCYCPKCGEHKERWQEECELCSKLKETLSNQCGCEGENMIKSKPESEHYKKLERAIELITKFNLTKDDLSCLTVFAIGLFVNNFVDYCKKEKKELRDNKTDKGEST